MPIFEYLCQECNHLFEAILLGSTRAQCPKCESKHLEQQISRFAVSGSFAAERAQDIPAAGASDAAAIRAVPAPAQIESRQAAHQWRG